MQNSWINGTSTMSSYWSLPPPLLSGCPPVSPLITPRWPPPSPLITPYHTDFTQGMLHLYLFHYLTGTIVIINT